MRLTVGPLPPAVYWRRRAVVLGSLLVVIVLLVYSCGGSDGSNASPRNAGTTSPLLGGGSTPTQSGDPATPSTSATGAADPGSVPTASPSIQPDRSLCTDDELLVTPVPAASQVPRGGTTQIAIKIKNKSNRTCKRDVGPDLQELYIVERGGAQKIWSSDDCGGPRGNKVESFTPGFEVAYTATWNGRKTTNCKDRPLPEIGQYQVYGRIGTKRSDPVALTLT
jgi:hypothetical protein